MPSGSVRIERGRGAFRSSGFQRSPRQCAYAICSSWNPPGLKSIHLCREKRGLPREKPMRRLLLISLAACALVAMPTLSASAMPIAKPTTLGGSDGIVLVTGGHGHGHGHMARGGAGPHYWGGRGRGHHYGWSRGRHRGWH